jgi:hypothetical protein
MKIRVVSKDVGVGENDAKTRVAWEYFSTCLRIKLRKNHLWVGGSCWIKYIKLEIVVKAKACKKNSFCKFSQSAARKCLSQIFVSLWVVPPF